MAVLCAWAFLPVPTCSYLFTQALVEVVTPEETARALAVGAKVIGVNNRNLRDFTVDSSKTRRVLESAGVVGPNATAEGRDKVGAVVDTVPLPELLFRVQCACQRDTRVRIH